jgi:predicted RNA-binding Zn ribbon-like protein
MSKLSRNPPFELSAGHPALDLVNTLDWRFRLDEDGQARTEELLASYRELLRFCVESRLMTGAQGGRLAGEAAGPAVLTAAKQLREAAAQLLYALLEGRHSYADSLRILEGFFQQARAHQQLAWANEDRVANQLAWRWPPGKPAAELPLWLLAASTAELVTSDDLTRLRACEREECRWLFLDTSKNHTRRWCNMKVCGNRVKAERFRASRKAAAR